MQLERQLRPDAYGSGPRRLHRPPTATDHRGREPVTDEAGHCSFCGSTRGPFTKVEGLFTVLICIPCLAVRQAQPDTRLGLHGPGPYPLMTRAQMRESLELLPSWVLAQKAAAFSVPACERTHLLALTTRHPVRWGGRSWRR
jgi:hypothetical protein